MIIYAQKCWNNHYYAVCTLYHLILYKLKKLDILYQVTEYMKKSNISVPTIHNNMDKLYVLVSYRDRKEHLDIFLVHMNKYLSTLQINYEIIIAEQSDNKLFNRGILYNTGVSYIINQNNNNNNIYICFHDVDILPTNLTNYFKPDNNNINHLYGYKFSLGGIFLMNLESYIKINGFSNKYWGWGYEDNDLLRRILLNNCIVNRTSFNIRYDKQCFMELDVDTNNPSAKMLLLQTQLNKKLFNQNGSYILDGLAQVHTCTSEQKVLEYSNHTLIKVFIN